MKQLFFFCFLLFGCKVFACSCMIGHPTYNFSRFEHVFKGKVVEILEYHPDRKRPKKIKVVQIDKYKGSQVEIITVSGNNMCPVPSIYLNANHVFYVNTYNEEFYIGSCNPTQVLYDWQEEQKDYDYFGIEELQLLKKLKSEFKERVNTGFILRNSGYPKLLIGINKNLYDRFTASNYKANVGLYLVRFLEDGKTIDNVEIRNSLGEQIDASIINYCKSEDFWKYQKDINAKQKLGSKLIIPIIIKRPRPKKT